MKQKQVYFLACCLALFFLACEKAEYGVPERDPNGSVTLETRSDAGATQISGLGIYADAADCDYPAQGAVFALQMSGDLEGCLFVYVDDYGCSPSGTYRESGREYFVGTYKGEPGTFWTNYKFEAKFEGCSDDGSFLGAEIFGRCQHPLEADSGTGIFEGVKGRLDFKDDVETGTFPYRGHFLYKE